MPRMTHSQRARVDFTLPTGACVHHTSTCKETLKLIMIHVTVRLRVPCLVPRASVLDASLASGLGSLSLLYDVRPGSGLMGSLVQAL